MLNAIVDASLRYKVLVLVFFAVVIGVGVQAFRNVPVDAFPDVTPIQVNIYTESPGLAAEDVEKLLTTPIEGAMAGLPGVEEVRSVSLFGLSYVGIYFKDDVDIYFARRLVGEKLQEAKGRLPQGYGEPVLGPNSSGLGQVFWYTVESADKSMSTMDLRTLHDWTVRLILRTVPGVDDVISWGGEQKQFQVQIDPRKLIKYGLSFKEVMERLTANNKQVGGQSINLGSEQYLVRGLGLVSSTSDIEQIVVAERNGAPVYVRDVAQVKQAPAPRFGAVTRDGKEAVLGIALARVNENAKTVVDAVKAKLAVAQAALPKGVTLQPVYDRTELVKKALNTAESSLLEGAILVAIILFLFLGEFRSAIVVVITLPMAMLIAFILMQQFGVSANLMSLAGLAIGTGMMVDGAVVMVENAFRLLAHAKESGKPIHKTHLILEAAREVVNPIAFAILIIIVVFLPLFSLTGLEGKLFKPMAYTITFAMAGSLLLSLTLVPVLAALILKPKEERDTFLVRRAKKIYLPLLDWALERKALVVGSAVVLLLASLALFPFLGKEFMPQLQEGTIQFRVTGIPSTSLDESIRISNEVSAELHKQFPQIRSVLATIGRAEGGETTDVNYMELNLDTKPPEEWPEKISYSKLAFEMQEALEKVVPTVVFGATQPIQSRVEELISGVRATLALKLYGEDLATLDRLTGKIQGVLSKVPGVADLSAEANKGKPQLVIKVNREAAARYGINADEILEVVQSGVGGSTVSTLIEGTKRFDIAVRLSDEFRVSPSSIASIPIRTAEGALVPFSQVATIEMDEGYSFIRRESLQRYSVLQMDVKGRDVDSFVKEANARLKEAVELPTGYWIEWGGSFENQQRAMARLGVIVPLTIGLIFILLYTAFNSVRHATIIIANVPFAIIGGIIGLFVSGQYLSVPSAIGFIAVFGVAMLNGIVMVTFLNDLRRQGLPIREAVQQGAALRLRPVLMTASVAILGLIPMLLSTGVGAETQRPLATVVVGGLFTSTALTLLILPLIWEWAEHRAERRKTAILETHVGATS
ncbi:MULTISPECIES: CusA/CzcA family heavy metal efflux RND transporter [unclassified Variovorax]|uniref:efflux RND transporter permease subunit n=1 Tax=unclassified Variovorax TaxID=663243 RepID=UPI00076C91E4|nr:MULTISPECIES: CusA/CzcA family heavy metal efflux RND transporter [unclassified Variovorax]KWT97315.1 Cobalt-zinc-cadmium resistance protein CzcA [Variovorax sp. WDL1]PNG48930.1 Cobalt-zinc-cadmium resistance protein CzcA [Variovorax sp. B4]PNG49800.1 Cobalt-zinc-cadmium resistance protein CzcA [Variovorax sp. B2]PNG50647.1 Cobalt-zinc-cadmium resistance protein CzcA [Variovorax sp. B2]PNG50672.1 Cobalt-zinc-cadmium resistance protein CzcA [Variovorax sp. B4]